MNSISCTVTCRYTRAARGLRISVAFIGLALSAPATLQAQASPYMTQTYIDTMIQQAFYNFNEAISLTAGQDDRLMEAIAHAKEVCRKMKRRAKGDPNEKYILWKVGELENHIILEERDLVLKKMRRGAENKNLIINRFNAELAKDRPDFGKLEEYYSQMTALDAGKAAQLEYSIRQRSHNLSRALAYAMEKAVIRGDMDAMRRDLAYVTANDRYLSVSLDKYQRLQRTLEAREDLEQLKAGLDEQLAEAQRLVDRNRFGEAWTVIGELQGDVAGVRTELEPRDAYRYDVEIGDLAEKISTEEDSLVRVNLRILGDRGVDQAIDYLDTVLREQGVSRLKTAKVDSAIVAAGGSRTGGHDEAIRRELSELTRRGGSGSLTLENAQQIAARRAQERADSLRAIAESEAHRLAELNRRKLEREAKLEAKREKKREKARERITKIYAYLEDNKVRRARRRFRRKQEFLEEYLSPVVFAMLEATVAQEYKAMKTGVRPADEIPEGAPIQIVIDEPDVEQTPAPTTPSPRPISTERAPVRPPERAPEDHDGNRERAREYVVKLYDLLEHNKAVEAYERFQRIREPLSEYIDRETFDVLEATIMQSYEYSQREPRKPAFSPAAPGR